VIEYIPGYEYLLEFVDSTMAHETAVKILRKAFWNYNKDKRDTRHNTAIQKVFNSRVAISKIRKFYINFLSIFIFDRKKRKKFRREKMAEAIQLVDNLSKKAYYPIDLCKKSARG